MATTVLVRTVFDHLSVSMQPDHLIDGIVENVIIRVPTLTQSYDTIFLLSLVELSLQSALEAVRHNYLTADVNS